MLKDRLEQIVEEAIKKSERENLIPRVSFCGFRDIRDTERFLVHRFSEDITSVKNFISKIRAEGGGDIPEDIQGGIKTCLNLDWSENSVKQVIMITDSVCHGTKYQNNYCADQFPQGSPDNLVLEQLVAELYNKNIELTAIRFNKQTDKMLQIMKECHPRLKIENMEEELKFPDSKRSLL